MSKVPCHYCGVEILEDTARRTNGYCMPHESYGQPFAKTLGGEIVILKYHTQSEIEKSLSSQYRIIFRVLTSFMKIGDKLVSFKVIPSRYQSLSADYGIAIYRDSELVNGFVTRWHGNPEYHMDIETIISKEKFKTYLEDDVWDKLGQKIQNEDVFYYFNSSPFSWDCLCGRELIFIKRNDEVIFEKLLSLN